MLYGLSTGINFISLLAALWLGLYLVTRSPRNMAAGLTALAVWCMAGYFLNQFLALYPPPTPPNATREWLYRIMLFWPRNVFEMGWRGWLEGWLPAYAIAFWYHATLSIRAGQSNRARWLKAGAGYSLALVCILLKVHYSPEVGHLSNSPLYSTGLRAPLFPLVLIAYGLLAGLSFYNLLLFARTGPARIPAAQLRLFFIATLLLAFTGGLEITRELVGAAIPQAFFALVLAAVTLLNGLGVARYTADLERRTFRADFIISAGGAAVIALLYLSILWAVSRSVHLPVFTFVGAGFLAVITHAFIDMVRMRLDLVHLQPQNQPALKAPQVSRPLLNPGFEEGQVLEAGQAVEISPGLVEKALRHLYDYQYLSELPLVNLKSARQHLEAKDGGSHTCIQQGKALADVLIEVLNAMRPEPDQPAGALPRCWYPYLILHDAYLVGIPNQDIMSRLYISEGTFNRTRRAAIGTLTMLLIEMEEKPPIG